MPQTNTSFSQRWFEEVWNKGSEQAIDEMLDKNAVANGLGEGTGRDAFKAFYHDFRKQFSDIVVSVKEVVKNDDMESALCDVQAIHKQTNKPIHFDGTSIIRVKDGKIIEAWNHFDFLKMYQQIGYKLIPA